jgi:hypothetical protein
MKVRAFPDHTLPTFSNLALALILKIRQGSRIDISVFTQIVKDQQLGD